MSEDTKEGVASENTTTGGMNLYTWDDGMEMYRPNLRRANLRWAALHWADLRRANLNMANLSKADLFMADLSDARNLEYAILPEGWREALKAAGLI
jgi:uncharacterized protein YbdZ (MbtH family)